MSAENASNTEQKQKQKVKKQALHVTLKFVLACVLLRTA